MNVLMKKISASPERMLIRDKVYDLPTKEANDLIERKAAVKIAEGDIKSYHTPPSTVPKEG